MFAVTLARFVRARQCPLLLLPWKRSTFETGADVTGAGPALPQGQPNHMLYLHQIQRTSIWKNTRSRRRPRGAAAGACHVDLCPTSDLILRIPQQPWPPAPLQKEIVPHTRTYSPASPHPLAVSTVRDPASSVLALRITHQKPSQRALFPPPRHTSRPDSPVGERWKKTLRFPARCPNSSDPGYSCSI